MVVAVFQSAPKISCTTIDFILMFSVWRSFSIGLIFQISRTWLVVRDETAYRARLTLTPIFKSWKLQNVLFIIPEPKQILLIQQTNGIFSILQILFFGTIMGYLRFLLRALRSNHRILFRWRGMWSNASRGRGVRSGLKTKPNAM